MVVPVGNQGNEAVVHDGDQMRLHDEEIVESQVVLRDPNDDDHELVTYFDIYFGCF